jgi:hypothetical protein
MEFCLQNSCARAVLQRNKFPFRELRILAERFLCNKKALLSE